MTIAHQQLLNQGGVLVSCLEQIAGGQKATYRYLLEKDGTEQEVRVARRKRKTLGLYVEKHQVPELRVPLNAGWSDIHDFLASRFDWLQLALVEIANLPASQINQYEPGGEIAFLGRLYAIEIVRSRYATVDIEADRLFLSCSSQPSERLIESRIMGWYRREAEKLFPDLLGQLSCRFSDPAKHTGLTIRRMKSRWGSCSASGEICLNLQLMREALPQIEFVVAHELCHLRHFAHNQAFYGLMDQVMPDWREREKLLGGVNPDQPISDY